MVHALACWKELQACHSGDQYLQSSKLDTFHLQFNRLIRIWSCGLYLSRQTRNRCFSRMGSSGVGIFSTIRHHHLSLPRFLPYRWLILFTFLSSSHQHHSTSSTATRPSITRKSLVAIGSRCEPISFTESRSKWSDLCDFDDDCFGLSG